MKYGVFRDAAGKECPLTDEEWDDEFGDDDDWEEDDEGPIEELVAEFDTFEEARDYVDDKMQIAGTEMQLAGGTTYWIDVI